jgi:predicted permease
MSDAPMWRRYLRFFRPDLDADLDDELAFHLEMRAEELVAKGMTPEAARAEALRRMRDVQRVKRECRRIDEGAERAARRREWLAITAQEARRGARSLRRSPAFTVMAMLTLALGLGATTAIFTLLDAVVLSPLPYAEANRLVHVASSVSGATASGDWKVSPGGYFYYRDNNTSFEDIGAYRAIPLTVTGGQGAERGPGVQVTASLMHVLRLRPMLGSLLTQANDAPGAASVAVLSHDFWLRRFGGDPHVIGRVMTIEAQPVEIVGVLAAGENLPDMDAAVWVPLGLDPNADFINEHYLEVIGRLREQSTVASAQADLARLTARFPDALPSVYSPSFMEHYHFAVQLSSLRDTVVGSTAHTLWMLLAAVGLVLLIACANVTNLFLARIQGRRREVAMRTALGAGRMQLAWHYLAESLVLSLLAGACALAIAYAALHILLAIAPPSIPRLSQVRLGWASVAFTAAVSLSAGLLFGLLPVTRADVDVAMLRESTRGMTVSRGQHAARSSLVIGQVALALVLLAAAGLMLQSVRHLRHVQPGFDARGVLAVDVALPYSRYRSYEDVSSFFHRLETRLEALPGVMSAGAITALPVRDGGGFCGIAQTREKAVNRKEGTACLPVPRIAPGYFRTMGISVRGTVPTWADVEHHTAGVVVSRAFAESVWPGEEAIGKGVNNGSGETFYRVVGVAEDVRANGMDQPPIAAVYYPIQPIANSGLWGPTREMSVVVRTRTAHPSRLTAAIRRTVADLDPDVPIADVQTMEQVIARSMTRTSFTMLLLGVAGGMALLLSAVGMYGVISYIVGQRRSEIGIRMALGAGAARVGAQVVLQSVRLAAAGIVLGVLGAIAVTRVLRSLLFEVNPTDPLVLGAVAALLLVLAAIASYIPARRAAHVDPTEALRAE